MHQNSLKAHSEESANFTLREKLILEVLRCYDNRTRWNGGLTDREIMKRLGFRDPNAVRPRLTELIERGVCEECGSVQDADTGKTVRLVRIKVTKPQGELF